MSSDYLKYFGKIQVDIGKEEIDLSKLNGFVFKEEFAEEAAKNNFINTIFNQIDGIKGKKDGILDEEELKLLAAAIDFNAGKNEKLSKKELKTFFEPETKKFILSDQNLEDFATFMQSLVDKLSPEKMDAKKKFLQENQLSREIFAKYYKYDSENKTFVLDETKLEKFKKNFIEENSINKEILEKYYEFDPKKETFVLKKIEDEQECKKRDVEICNLILETIKSKIDTTKFPSDILLNSENVEAGSNVFVIENKDFKVVFSLSFVNSEINSTGGDVEFYRLDDKTRKFDILDTYKMSPTGNTWRFPENYDLLLDLFLKDSVGAEKIIKDLIEAKDTGMTSAILDRLSIRAEEEIPMSEIDADGNIIEVLSSTQRLGALIGYKELSDDDYIEKDGIRILASPEKVSSLEDFITGCEYSPSLWGVPEDDPDIFRYDDSKLDGKIDSWLDIMQKSYGNCWAVQSLQSLLLNPQGKKFVNEILIKENYDEQKNVDEIIINTALRKQVYDNESVKSLNAILSQDSDKDAIGLLRQVRSFRSVYVSNKDGTYKEIPHEDDYSGGTLEDFVLSVFGKNAQVKKYDKTGDVKNFLCQNKAGINTHKYLTQLAFGGDVKEGSLDVCVKSLSKSPKEKDYLPQSIDTNHAYTIYSMDNNGNVTLIDPRYRALITLKLTDLLKHPAVQLEVAEISELIKSYKQTN